jgi:ubiquinone/menaquinone biosynthesis C-methylase UbiE
MTGPAADDSGGRLAREIEHHRRIAGRAEEIWNWDSPAGRKRAERRAEMLVAGAALGPGCRALEVGCGTGVFLEKVAPCGAEIRGIDLSQDLLARARARMSAFANVRLTCGNAEQMPFPTGTFDAAYGSSVLHHLNLERSLREILRVLKPGGRIAFAEPNIWNPQVAVMFHYGPSKEYFGVSPDEMAFSRFHARRTLLQAGYRNIAVRPFDFLHPSTPEGWLDAVGRLSLALEATPLLREIAGSLLVTAAKP